MKSALMTASFILPFTVLAFAQQAPPVKATAAKPEPAVTLESK